MANKVQWCTWRWVRGGSHAHLKLEKQRGEMALLDPSVIWNQAGLFSETWSCCQRRRPRQRGRRRNTCLLPFPHPPLSCQCLPLADTGVWEMQPAGSSCCDTEQGKDVEWTWEQKGPGLAQHPSTEWEGKRLREDLKAMRKSDRFSNNSNASHILITPCAKWYLISRKLLWQPCEVGGVWSPFYGWGNWGSDIKQLALGLSHSVVELELEVRSVSLITLPLTTTMCPLLSYSWAEWEGRLVISESPANHS